jgi:hypothetical protein
MQIRFALPGEGDSTRMAAVETIQFYFLSGIGALHISA